MSAQRHADRDTATTPATALDPEVYRAMYAEVRADVLRGMDFELRQMMEYADECESPLEELFLLAFARQMVWGYTTCSPQVEFGPYRVDFLVERNEGKAQVVVEIDGHDFHEKTKAQAERDKKRDRYFQQIGMPVLRFSGREVWRDPAACVREVSNLLNKMDRS